MILSFHPLIYGHKNILCAGRDPDETDLKAIRKASAVILPIGCGPKLYWMARQNCDRVFPNYGARFLYPGKIGQIRLFRKTGAEHPTTFLYEDFSRLKTQCPEFIASPPMIYPFVFKFDWGGEGDNVFFVKDPPIWIKTVELVRRYEASGQRGFLIQKFIDSMSRTLRCVVIGEKIISYWRISKNCNEFKNSLSSGAKIDYNSDQNLIKEAENTLKTFLEKTGVNLGGFDFLFSRTERRPLMLEINYFFGRRGLGGSERFNRILAREINFWLLSAGCRGGVFFNEM